MGSTGGLVGVQFERNGQKLHENKKIDIFASKQWEDMGVDKAIFRLVKGIHPSPPH